MPAPLIPHLIAGFCVAGVVFLALGVAVSRRVLDMLDGEG